jgi:hypothetical protein
MVLPLITMGTGTHVPPTNLRYCVPAGTGLGKIIVNVTEVAGANPVIDHEKNPNGYEPAGGEGERPD